MSFKLQDKIFKIDSFSTNNAVALENSKCLYTLELLNRTTKYKNNLRENLSKLKNETKALFFCKSCTML